MLRNPKIYLQDISTSCGKIERYIHNLSSVEFLNDDKTVDAVIRNLTVIGEAAKNLPAAIRERYAQVEWRKIAGLRDLLIHKYFGIDDDLLWNIANLKIPPLREQIEEILAEFPKDLFDE